MTWLREVASVELGFSSLAYFITGADGNVRSVVVVGSGNGFTGVSLVDKVDGFC